MNLADARTELGDRGFDYLPANRMTFFLNRAKNDFEDFWTWPWLWTTVTAPAPLMIPDLKYVIVVKDAATTREITGMDYRQLAQDGTDLSLTGTPAHWYLTDTTDDAVTLRVWPVAQGSLDVTYVKASRELASNTDVPAIPTRYHPIWIDLAVVSAYKDSDNFPAANTLMTDVQGRLQQLVERYETRNRQNSGYISLRSMGEDE